MISPSVRLSRPLGAGGMGTVWLADHLALKTQVVVKFMSASLGADPLSRERFAREAVAAAQVKSPHVVQTFDHGLTTDGTPFIVMEWLEGEDLAHRIRSGPVDLSALASILTQVCRALARAHAVGIVHRDIKPDNIFLCDVGGSEPFVKLLDFGIAKATLDTAPESRTRTGAMMGTPYYMSPEQFAGTKNIDFRTDLWSLGVVAFECLTGARPFEAETIGALVIAVHAGEIPIPSAVRAGLPAAMDAWFLRACARDPAARFQSALEFSEAFTRAVAGAPVASVDPLAKTEARLPPRGGALQTTGAASSLVRASAPAPEPTFAARSASGAKSSSAGEFAPSAGLAPGSPPRRSRTLRLLAAMGAVGVAGAGAVVLSVILRTHGPSRDPGGTGSSQGLPASIDVASVAPSAATAPDAAALAPAVGLAAPAATAQGSVAQTAAAQTASAPSTPARDTASQKTIPNAPPSATSLAPSHPIAPVRATAVPRASAAQPATSPDPFQPHVF
jgi:eukaryotic-like serine/threonine-protein kinase